MFIVCEWMCVLVDIWGGGVAAHSVRLLTETSWMRSEGLNQSEASVHSEVVTSCDFCSSQLTLPDWHPFSPKHIHCGLGWRQMIDSLFKVFILEKWMLEKNVKIWSAYYLWKTKNVIFIKCLCFFTINLIKKTISLLRLFFCVVDLLFCISIIFVKIL